MQSIDITPWYSKYLNFPYRHLGNNTESGIDCFNLCRLVYKEQLGIEIPYDTADWCNIVDEDWYNKTQDRPFDKGGTEAYGWKKTNDEKTILPEPKYDAIFFAGNEKFVLRAAPL